MPISLTSLRFGDISSFSDDTTSPSPKPSQTADSDPSAILLPRGTFENPYVGFPSLSAAQATWAEIADVTGCAIELVHHTRKTGGADVTVEDGRGGSALLAKVRSGRVINVMSDAEASKAGVKNRRFFFRVENGKASM